MVSAYPENLTHPTFGWVMYRTKRGDVDRDPPISRVAMSFAVLRESSLGKLLLSINRRSGRECGKCMLTVSEGGSEIGVDKGTVGK